MLPQIPPFHDPFDDLRNDYHHHHLRRRRRNRRFNRQSLARGCGAVLVLIVAVLTLSSTTFRKTSQQSSRDRRRHHHDVITTSDDGSRRGACRSSRQNPTIHPGELPGYTGWSRPENTMARYFSPIDDSSTTIVGTTWSTILTCQLPDGRRCYDATAAAPQFFVRAYGPSVVSGSVVRDDDASPHRFRATVTNLVDPGSYAMEVVLTFSNASRSSWMSFPLEEGEEDVAYEGYLLPGFPMMVTVCGGDEEEDVERRRRRWCSRDDLYWNESRRSDDGPSLGRWKVIDKNTLPSHRERDTPSNNNTAATLTGYQHGFNSLGIRMEYQPTTSSRCRLFNRRELTHDDDNHILDHCLNHHHHRNANSTHHVIFIGDSVMARQKSTFESQLLSSSSSYSKNNDNNNRLRTTFLSTHGGISQTLPRIVDSLHSILLSRGDDSETYHYYVIFNTGLHDVARLCSRGYREFRKEVLNMTTTTPKRSCVERYREDVGRLVEVVRDFPARLKVFRTTTAAWPKYGNYGFAWPVTQMQILPFATEFARVMNDVAISVVRDNNNDHRQLSSDDDDDIKILDAYWLSHSRPDHTEVTSDRQEIGKHLVHPGVEVLYTMSVQWFMVILGYLCGEEVLEGWMVDDGDGD